MQLIKKLLDLRRLDYKTAANIFIILVRKKICVKLNESDKEYLEFFDCLRLIHGQIIVNKESYMILLLSKLYGSKFIYLRTGPTSSDIAVFKQVLCWEEYKPVVQAYKQYFQEKDTVNIIDAGGNIGLTSLYFSAHFKNSKIVSVEPDIGNFKMLSANLSQLNIACVQGAVWSKNTYIKLIMNFRDQLSWSYRTEETNEMDRNAINAYTIMRIKEKNRFEYVDILKMDIEGAEAEIFCSANLDFLIYTKCIAIEIHDEFNCREIIYNCLEENNFTYFNRGELTIGINKKLLD